MHTSADSITANWMPIFRSTGIRSHRLSQPPKRFDTPIANCAASCLPPESRDVWQDCGQPSVGPPSLTGRQRGAQTRRLPDESTYGSIPGTSSKIGPSPTMTWSLLRRASMSWSFPDLAGADPFATPRKEAVSASSPSINAQGELFATQPGDLDGTPSRLRSRS